MFSFHFMPANDMKETVFGHRKFPRLSLGSILVHLALEARALTTELPRYLKYVFLYVFVWDKRMCFVDRATKS